VTVTVAAPASSWRRISRAKGSITVDGVSLTVNEVTDQPNGAAHFTLNIIPHTQEMTTLERSGRRAVRSISRSISSRAISRGCRRAPPNRY
jgi:riboflavin synthase